MSTPLHAVLLTLPNISSPAGHSKVSFAETDEVVATDGRLTRDSTTKTTSLTIKFATVMAATPNASHTRNEHLPVLATSR